MLVKYIGKIKYEYNGNQYQPNSIIDMVDVSNIDQNKFELVTTTKAHIELQNVKGLLKQIESDLNDMKKYHKQYKDRETELLKIVNVTTATENVTVKSDKKIKKEVI